MIYCIYLFALTTNFGEVGSLTGFKKKKRKVFNMLPSCSIVEELHHMPFCEQESSLPPDELLEMFSLALAIAPAMSIAGVVLCRFEFIALSACASVCACILCVCVFV